MKKYFFLLFFALPLALDSTTAISPQSCEPPSNVRKTGSTSTSFSFAWDGNLDASEYKLYYIKDDSTRSSDFFTTSPIFTFSNLSDGSYDFYFVTICAGNEASLIVIEDQIMG